MALRQGIGLDMVPTRLSGSFTQTGYHPAPNDGLVAMERSIFWAFVSAGLAALTGCGFAARTYNTSGVRLYQQGQVTQAADQFRRAIQTDPLSADGYYNLARVLHEQGRAGGQADITAQAETYYRQCLQHDANHRDAHRGLAVLLAQQNRSEEAFRMLEDWAARSPTQPDPRIELARLTEEFGDREAAKEYLIDALQANPRDTRALAALGKIRETEGDTEQALANYQRALAANPRDAELARQVSDISLRMARSNSAGTTHITPTTRVVSNPPGAPR